MNTAVLRGVMTVARVWLGYQWLKAGLGKVQSPAWMETGAAVRGYWMRVAGLLPDTDPAITYAWYQGFIERLVVGEHHTWFAPLIAVGEVLVGVALILGSFTVLAAIMGAFMNLNFMLAGTASTNPILYTIAILIVVSGSSLAGYYGADRVLVPLLRERVISWFRVRNKEPWDWIGSWMGGEDPPPFTGDSISEA